MYELSLAGWVNGPNRLIVDQAMLALVWAWVARWNTDTMTEEDRVFTIIGMAEGRRRAVRLTSAEQVASSGPWMP